MSIGFRPHPSGGVFRVSPFFVALVLALWAGTAVPEDLNVTCPAGSINAALGTLDKTVTNSVRITGMCTEAVVVDGFNNLGLEAAAPGAGIQRLDTSDPWPGVPALRITASTGVRITGLTFQGPGPNDYVPPLVSISRSTGIGIENCLMQGSRTGGLGVDDHSDVWIAATTIQNNGAGIGANGDSHVSVSMWLSDWYPGGGASSISSNGGGVSAVNGATIELGDVTLEDNVNQAVSASNGATVTLGGWNPKAPVITGNAVGPYNSAVSAGSGGEIWIVEPTKIQGNLSYGASSNTGGRLILCCGPGIVISDNAGFGIEAWMGGGVFFWGPALIEKNKWAGMSIYASEVWSSPGVVIRENGDPSDPNSLGGVTLTGNSFAGGTWNVAGNYGPGVMLGTGASASLDGNSVITGNKGYGVSLEANATATFADGATVTGNKGFDLVCTSGSVAGTPKGAHPTIGKMKCPDWAQLTPPPAWATATLGAAASAMSRPPRPR